MNDAMSRYYQDRATGRNTDSKKFQADWSQREKAVQEFLKFAGFDSADELIAKFAESVDSKRSIDQQLYAFYLSKTESMKKSSAKQVAMKVAAMFTSNYQKISTKQISKDAKETSGVRKERAKTPFFEYDEEGNVVGFNDMARDFFGRLNHRDRAVLLASASSGQPVSVILKLTVGEVRTAQKKGQERIVLMNDRSKTGEAYLTFVSVEATKMIYAYLDSDRNGADDSEPLFMARAGEALRGNHLAKSTRRVCDAMGIIANGTNPYTPYAMRSVFRIASDGVPSIPENVKKRMMGHALSEGEGYGVIGTSGILPHYMKIEPIVTLAHQPSEQEKQLNQRIEDLERRLGAKDGDIEHLENQVKELAELVKSLIGEK